METAVNVSVKRWRMGCGYNVWNSKQIKTEQNIIYHDNSEKKKLSEDVAQDFHIQYTFLIWILLSHHCLCTTKSVYIQLIYSQILSLNVCCAQLWYDCQNTSIVLCMWDSEPHSIVDYTCVLCRWLLTCITHWS